MSDKTELDSTPTAQEEKIGLFSNQDEHKKHLENEQLKQIKKLRK